MLGSGEARTLAIRSLLSKADVPDTPTLRALTKIDSLLPRVDVGLRLMDIMAQLRSIGASYRTGDLQAGLIALRSLWARVPDPKPETANAYLVVEYGVAFALKDGDLDEAQRWADRAPMFAAVRHDLGEAEFLLGRVAFERGDLLKAKEQFLVANMKSEGRAFEAKDERYRSLIEDGG